jgi:hypothetical protein
MKRCDWRIILLKSPVAPTDCACRQLFGVTGAIIKKGEKRGEGEEEEERGGRRKGRKDCSLLPRKDFAPSTENSNEISHEIRTSNFSLSTK